VGQFNKTGGGKHLQSTTWSWYTVSMAEWRHTRDASLQTEHERWGTNLPAVDIDHLLIEYSQNKPRALIEYKHESARIDWHKSTFRALINLGNAAGLPVFTVRYADSFKWWQVFTLNDRAKEIVPHKYKNMDKKEFVELLYELRGIAPPGAIWRKLGLGK